jgi:hypothetical protein
MNKINPKFVSLLTNVYDDNFNYLDPKEFLISEDYKTVKCNLKYKNSRYLKKSNSKLFNNAEAVFSFNQLSLTHIITYIAQTNNDFFVEDIDINLDSFEKYKKIIGNFVLLNQKQTFKKNINEQLLIPAINEITKIRKIKNNYLIYMTTTIGSENNFFFETKGFMTQEDLHGL